MHESDNRFGLYTVRTERTASRKDKSIVKTVLQTRHLQKLTNYWAEENVLTSFKNWCHLPYHDTIMLETNNKKMSHLFGNLKYSSEELMGPRRNNGI